MPRQHPHKIEIARMKVLSDLGQSPTAIARRLNRSHHTVIKYLQSGLFTDPGIQELIKKIKAKELEDLYLLGAKGRMRLHELLDQGNSHMIETIALVDRTFNQRRLLEGESTANFSIYSRLEELGRQIDENRKLQDFMENEIKRRQSEEDVLE